MSCLWSGWKKGRAQGQLFPTCSIMFRGVPSLPMRTPMLIIGRVSSLERPTRPRRVRPAETKRGGSSAQGHLGWWGQVHFTHASSTKRTCRVADQHLPPSTQLLQGGAGKAVDGRWGTHKQAGAWVGPFSLCLAPS